MPQPVVADLNDDTRRDTGRPGFDDWQVLVLIVSEQQPATSLTLRVTI